MNIDNSTCLQRLVEIGEQILANQLTLNAKLDKLLEATQPVTMVFESDKKPDKSADRDVARTIKVNNTVNTK